MDDTPIHYHETREFRRAVKFSDCRTPCSHAVERVAGGWAVKLGNQVLVVFPSEQEAENLARKLNES